MGANMSLLRAWESWVNFPESHSIAGGPLAHVTFVSVGQSWGGWGGHAEHPPSRGPPALPSPALCAAGHCHRLAHLGQWPGQRTKLHRGQAVPRAAVVAHEVAKGVKVIGLYPRERGRWRVSICPSVVSSHGAGLGHSGHFQELLIIETVFWDFCEENRL